MTVFNNSIVLYILACLIITSMVTGIAHLSPSRSFSNVSLYVPCQWCHILQRHCRSATRTMWRICAPFWTHGTLTTTLSSTCHSATTEAQSSPTGWDREHEMEVYQGLPRSTHRDTILSLSSVTLCYTVMLKHTMPTCTVPCESIRPPWTLRPFATFQASIIKI